MSKKKGIVIFQSVLLLFTSVLVTLGSVEIGLRVFYPKYEQAAEAQFQPDSLRITTRPPNTRHSARHPDTGRAHQVIYNNYGMRQSRDFEISELNGAINVGIFGDSYVENLSLPSPYSFTEPLDYLLNLGGTRANVLNFGQSGYGTGQSFISYSFSPLVEYLDHVFYVFCVNDIRNIYENDLFNLNPNGSLIRNPALATPWWIKSLSRLHVTYVVQDGINRLFPSKNDWRGLNARIVQEKHADNRVRERMKSDEGETIQSHLIDGKDSDNLHNSLAIFTTLLQDWEKLANENGASFTVVLLPQEQGSVIKQILAGRFDILDLRAKFLEDIPGYDYKNWRFENDGHWAEAANSLAVKYLYAHITYLLASTPLSQLDIDHALVDYYSAFDHGWNPEDGSVSTGVSELEKNQIRFRYIPLEDTSG